MPDIGLMTLFRSANNYALNNSTDTKYVTQRRYEAERSVAETGRDESLSE